ncbi:MAG: transglutaminaseTgpA domain-containing protein [Acidimicrobiaceae bacterium]|nr:transglutaminaseTgpA domain-containing protein [Acidimicrobiaceae bacterium]
MNPRRLTVVIAEASLISASVVAAISLERVFVDLAFLRDVLLMAVASHLLAVACRRAKFKMGLSTIISAATLILLTSAVFYPDESLFVLPTAETVRALGDDLSSARSIFASDSAPVEPLRGFVVSASALIWLGAFLADSAVFRLRSFVEAAAPATSVLAFTAIFGVARNQVAHGIAYTAAITAVLLSMRALNNADDEGWIASEARRGVSSILRVGALFGLAAVTVAGFATPRIPGVDSEPLFDITEFDDPPATRNIVSPLVNVSASLVEQSDQEIFSVRVAEGERDYWRLMALTTFNGSQWERTSNFDEIRGRPGSAVDSSVGDRTTLTQTVTKRSRGEHDIYLPVAYELNRVLDDGGVDLEYELATGALVYNSDSQEQAEQGFRYTVESLIPDYDPSRLAERAAAGLDDEFLAEHVQLPPVCGPEQSTATHICWPERISALARQVTQNAANDYQRARMLQDFFRNPANFSYDLDVVRRHSVATAEDFLFSVRSGYCEQFASVFAAMARSLGIPTRVAVGYTWGSWNPERQEYVVRGHHAHAWPEVYFSGAGWIAFEPTPGRSRPRDSDITGHADARQYPSNLVGELSEAPVPTPTRDSSSRQSAPSPSPTASGSAGDSTAVADSQPRGAFDLILMILMAVAVVAALLAVSPALRAVRRRRRLLRASDDPVRRAELAWDDAVRALELLGLSPERHQTPLEFASEAGRVRDELEPLLTALAANITALRYSDAAVASAGAHDARRAARAGHANGLALGAKEASAHIVDRCHNLAGLRRVALAAVSPRGLADDRADRGRRGQSAQRERLDEMNEKPAAR